jgi:hypothetical protein
MSTNSELWNFHVVEAFKALRKLDLAAFTSSLITTLQALLLKSDTIVLSPNDDSLLEVVERTNDKIRELRDDEALS